MKIISYLELRKKYTINQILLLNYYEIIYLDESRVLHLEQCTQSQLDDLLKKHKLYSYVKISLDEVFLDDDDFWKEIDNQEKKLKSIEADNKINQGLEVNTKIELK